MRNESVPGRIGRRYFRTGGIVAIVIAVTLLFSCVSYSPLMKSARDGDLDGVRTMIAEGRDVDERSDDGVTALMLAAMNGHAKVVSFLLDNGADPKLREIYGNTALHYAKNCVECAKSILDKSGEVDIRNNKGATPLMFAAKVSNPDVVKFLLQSGANVNAVGHGGLTPLLFAVIASDTSGVIKELVTAGARVDQRDTLEDLTPMFHAALDGNVGAVTFLLSAGADICATDRDGRPMLEVIGENIRHGIWRNAAGGANSGIGSGGLIGGLIGAGVNAAFSAAQLRAKMKPVVEFLESKNAPENAEEAVACAQKRVKKMKPPVVPEKRVLPDPAGDSDVVASTGSRVGSANASGDDGGANCFPPCRSGFRCQGGVCISECNPPCPAGSICSEGRDCVSLPMESEEAYEMKPQTPAETEEEKDDPEDSRRYKGFFLEVRPVGIGMARSVLSYDGGWIMMQNLMLTTLGLSVGTAPIRNLAIFGAVEMGIPFPAKSRITMPVEGYEISDSIALITGFFGAGVRYYLPLQIFIGFQAGLQAGPMWGDNDYEEAIANDDWYATDDSDSTTRGAPLPFALRFEAGKEWWIGSKWTMGVGLTVSWGKTRMTSNNYWRSWSDPEFDIAPELRNTQAAVSLRIGRH
ncbi:MAG: ankyrin repeat domain-containing protein [Chitinispirillaceae bacterium]|nr:ankyrin repeat domain-containing protein [Chitinispirillaceae bacterium]